METNSIDILLVEDNPNDVELTRRALKKAGISDNILVITDGVKALDYFFKDSNQQDNNQTIMPKVVILDLKLPKVGGIEILKKIKSNEHTKLIPVVILTSSREERDILESYKLGANSYIVKPVAYEKFADAVRDIGIYWLLLNQSAV